jgi:hypothetical protein
VPLNDSELPGKVNPRGPARRQADLRRRAEGLLRELALVYHATQAVREALTGEPTAHAHRRGRVAPGFSGRESRCGPGWA